MLNQHPKSIIVQSFKHKFSTRYPEYKKNSLPESIIQGHFNEKIKENPNYHS